MPAYLRNGNIHFNQTRKIHPIDPIAKLDYYLASTSSVSSSSVGSLHTSQPSLPTTNEQLSEHSSKISHQTFGINDRFSSTNLEELTRRIHGRRLNFYEGLSNPSQHPPTGIIRKRRIRAHQVMLNEGDSGLSDDTRVETTWHKSFERDLNIEPLNEINWMKSRTQSSAGNQYVMKQQQQQSQVINREAGNVVVKPQIRIKRRNMGRNRRMLVNGNDEMVDPYALSELFSQSEIPGFREIFASDSYLRKFCWILAFLIMTVLSLNEFTQLLKDYFDYPITVDVRQRDSPRLPFPSVTVCNLNVVRFSALCSPSASARLFDQMPVELREKLCGVQVEKTNSTELNDINNIGLVTTTTSATTTLDSVTSTSDPSLNITDDDSAEIVSSRGPTISQPITSSSDDGESTGQSTVASGGPTTTQRRTTQAGGLDLGDFVNPVQLVMGQSATSNRRNSQVIGAKSGLIKKRSIQLNDRRKERPFASGSTKVRVKHSQQISQADSLQNRQPAQALSQHPTMSAPNRNVNTNLRQTVIPNLPTSFNPLIVGHMPTTTSWPQVVINQPTVQPFAPPNLPDDFELSEREERELQENLTNWLAVLYNRDPNLTRSLGHQFDDMILRCTMKSVNCTHQRGFENSFSPTEGNCFQYKSRIRRRHASSSPGEIQYDDANLAGTNQGLELVLNLEKSEYISGSSQVGALVMIHHPSDTGYAASEATFVAPEFTTYIGLKMVNITRLEAPYPEYCVDTWPKKFADKQTRGSTYSQQSCLKICLQKTIQSHCLCQSATLPTLDMDSVETTSDAQNDSAIIQQQKQKIIICDTRKLLTRQCVKEVMARAADRVHNCECPPKCRVIRYDKTISTARWPTREDKVSFDRGKMDVNFQNLAKVIVYFQTMTCEETVQKAVFDKTKLFSAIGGIMGMYVGFSFLSIFEIFEVMSRKTWHHFRVKWSIDNSGPQAARSSAQPQSKTSSPREMEQVRFTPTKRNRAIPHPKKRGEL